MQGGERGIGWAGIPTGRRVAGEGPGDQGKKRSEGSVGRGEAMRGGEGGGEVVEAAR